MMPIMWLPFLLLSAAAEAQQGTSLKPGSPPLTPKTIAYVPSPSGRYAFGFYEQGNGTYAVGIFLAGLPQKTVVWTANRDGPPLPADINLVFTTDGRLVLQPAQGGQETLVINNAPEGASSASMLNSGNFVLNGSANQILWQSFDHPTDTLLPTQNLINGTVLSSSLSKSNQTTGKFLLLMQEDGVLAMYPVGTPYTKDYGYWSSVDWPSKLTAVEGWILTLNGSGSLNLFNGAGTGTDTQNLASGNSTKPLYRLTIDPDGILRLYSHDGTKTGNWTVEWSMPDNGCAPKGLCGLNEYCVLNPDVDCKCLPGFAPVDEGDWGSGCKRNFTVEWCSASSKYTMEEESNTAWENDTYSLPISSTKANCRDACLQDCNCEAALFKDDKCTKLRLPLRFGRKDTSGSIAFIKVGTSSTLPKEGKKFLIIGISLVVFAFIVLAISGFGIYKNHVRMSKNGYIELGEDVAPKSFTYAQLEVATLWFNKELGRGASGIVYEGEMSNGQTKEIVAVKMLDTSMLAERADRHFRTEMTIDSSLPNEEVSLKEWANCCFDRGELGKLVNNEEVDKRELEKMVKLGLWCASDEFPLRPPMQKVLRILDGIENIPASASLISFSD
ncbi:hypothetical protein FH972_000741 [Carpinus fangiana]|uniref:Bulb-type lectin domain-containing protein n=1 Tax=Carpinus fangiana TaxID=176857 RepID=A0A5N6QC03_9ROSI|nr:hypothetical protein FH972_000741 [Carpinus fangiana]